MAKRLHLSGLIFGLFSLASMPVSALDLLQIYRDAQNNDSTYAAARAQAAASREKYPQGRAGLLPVVNYTASKTRVNTTTDYDTHTQALTLTQPLFRWANWESFEQGKLQAAQAETVFAQAGADLIVRVAQAYFDVLAAQDTIAFIEAQQSAITQQLEQAKRNFEVGTATVTDQQEAQARYDLAVAQEIAARADLENKRNALRLIVGKPVNDLRPLPTKVVLSGPQPANAEPWVKSAEENNYAVMIQQFNQKIAEHEIGKARGGHLPTLDLTASRNKNYQSFNSLTGTDSNTTSTQIGVQLTVPLFAGGGTQSHVRETIALEDKAQQDLESARRNAAQTALQSFAGVQSGLAQVRALEAAEKSSQLALESNKLGYEVGVRINIDVLNAQQQLFQTQRDLAKARYDTLINGLKLKASNATLSDEDVEAINRLLESGTSSALPLPPRRKEALKLKADFSIAPTSVALRHDAAD
ncbi:MAG: channel protein TolC [Burkholderiaceae bacterium]|nr:MAG: channel protein TolC [Burkholderiaceae bacterium]